MTHGPNPEQIPEPVGDPLPAKPEPAPRAPEPHPVPAQDPQA